MREKCAFCWLKCDWLGIVTTRTAIFLVFKTQSKSFYSLIPGIEHYRLFFSGFHCSGECFILLDHHFVSEVKIIRYHPSQIVMNISKWYLDYILVIWIYWLNSTVWNTEHIWQHFPPFTSIQNNSRTINKRKALFTGSLFLLQKCHGLNFGFRFLGSDQYWKLILDI